MNYISAEGITKVHGEKTLFQNLNFGINLGDRVGLIGVNGSGKTTLLRILAGLDMPDSGTVAVRKGIRMGYLDQNPIFEESATVFDNVFNGNHPLIQLIRSYEQMLVEDKNAPDYEARMHNLVEQMTLQHAWEYEHRIKEIISRLGIGEMAQKQVSLLSGGERKRVSMARVLMEEPDFLIMDEPTNHLDMETVEWLEELIKDRFPTLLLVTHDRYFLDSVTNHIMELDQGTVFKYKGDYAYFLEKKAEREQVRDAEIEKSRNLMRKELEWIRRQPKARGTKAKYRVDAFETLKEKATLHKPDAKLELQMKTSRQGGKVLNVKNITKKFGTQPIINAFTHYFQKGEKVGIIGKNGAGKSTFLNMLTGRLTPDSGDVDAGENTIFGYYKQEEIVLEEDKRMIEMVKDIAEVVELANGDKISASQFLQMFLFPPAMQYTYISKLSGGEKRRLQLLKILITNPNFLILDEPTNDLDISTLNVLEDFLQNYTGTLLLVSHDRYFMDKLVDHIFVFEGQGEIRDFPGNYTSYREWKKEEAEKEKTEKKKEVAPIIEKPQTATTEKTNKKRSFKENREYEQLTVEIDALESEKASLTAELNNSSTDYQRLTDISLRIKNIDNDLDEKGMRWLELSEME